MNIKKYIIKKYLKNFNKAIKIYKKKIIKLVENKVN